MQPPSGISQIQVSTPCAGSIRAELPESNKRLRSAERLPPIPCRSLIVMVDRRFERASAYCARCGKNRTEVIPS